MFVFTHVSSMKTRWAGSPRHQLQLPGMPFDGLAMHDVIQPPKKPPGCGVTVSPSTLQRSTGAASNATRPSAEQGQQRRHDHDREEQERQRDQAP
ncbi:hypothetical protein [Sphingomonas sp.]|uniref:hypothetical protein n=1 Tax=Sphingomonas sp. TaxID=28214 RepID=UPI0035BBB58C